ncbi:MAG: hypothetical protein OEV93_03930 [Candidatus Moranbacteria bacterium]|nr:hypothetical protein [Candidatus Moranbacteria bacterium]
MKIAYEGPESDLFGVSGEDRESLDGVDVVIFGQEVTFWNDGSADLLSLLRSVEKNARELKEGVLVVRHGLSVPGTTEQIARVIRDVRGDDFRFKTAFIPNIAGEFFGLEKDDPDVVLQIDRLRLSTWGGFTFKEHFVPVERAEKHSCLKLCYKTVNIGLGHELCLVAEEQLIPRAGNIVYNLSHYERKMARAFLQWVRSQGKELTVLSAALNALDARDAREKRQKEEELKK